MGLGEPQLHANFEVASLVTAKILKGNPKFWGAPLSGGHAYFSTAHWLEQSRRSVIWIISSNSYSNGLSGEALNVFFENTRIWVKLLVFRSKLGVKSIFCFCQYQKALVVMKMRRLSHYVSKSVERCLL